MNEFIVDYNNKTTKTISLITGGYLLIVNLWTSIQLFLADNIKDISFYLAIAGIILALICILYVTVWAPKPLVKITSDIICINMEGGKTYSAQWIDIKSVGFGINFLNIAETSGKSYKVKLGNLKYTDLKNTKSQIMEMCESKTIPYHND